MVIWHFYGRQKQAGVLHGLCDRKSAERGQPVCIFSSVPVFAVKEEYQQRVLGYGILGALVMRGLMIAAGAELVERFQLDTVRIRRVHRICRTAYVIARESEGHPKIIFWCAISANTATDKEYRGEKFFLAENGQLFRDARFSWCYWWWRSATSRFAVDSIRRSSNSPQCIYCVQLERVCDFGIAGRCILAGERTGEIGVPEGWAGAGVLILWAGK